MNDDTDFALDIIKQTFGTDDYIFADQVLRFHAKVDAEQRITFWGISDQEKDYLKHLAQRCKGGDTE